MPTLSNQSDLYVRRKCRHHSTDLTPNIRDGLRQIGGLQTSRKYDKTPLRSARSHVERATPTPTP